MAIKGGLVKIEYSANSDMSDGATIAGVDPSASSTISLENIINETTRSRVYGGESMTATINLFTRTTLAAITTLMNDDTARYWRFEFGSGHTYRTLNAIIPLTRDLIENKLDARQGRVEWELQLEFHSGVKNFTVTDPA